MIAKDSMDLRRDSVCRCIKVIRIIREAGLWGDVRAMTNQHIEIHWKRVKQVLRS